MELPNLWACGKMKYFDPIAYFLTVHFLDWSLPAYKI
jgi:hypothetical protein